MSLPIRVVVHELVRYPNASGPRRSNFTKRRRWVSPRRRGRPGENRTRNACSPPRWRESRQRMTELGSHGMRRPTSLSEYPASSNFKARLRRSSSRSALPLSLGIGAPPEHLLLHFLCPTCIIYAQINRNCQWTTLQAPIFGLANSTPVPKFAPPSRVQPSVSTTRLFATKGSSPAPWQVLSGMCTTFFSSLLL